MIIIGVLVIDVSIVYMETIKEKRNILRSLKDRTRKKFNVSVSEIIDKKNDKGHAKIVITTASGDKDHINKLLSKAFNLIDRAYPDIIVSYHTDFLFSSD